MSCLIQRLWEVMFAMMANHLGIQLRLKPREDSSGAVTVGCHLKGEYEFI